MPEPTITRSNGTQTKRKFEGYQPLQKGYRPQSVTETVVPPTGGSGEVPAQSQVQPTGQRPNPQNTQANTSNSSAT